MQVLKSLTVQRTVRPALILNDIGILSGDNGEIQETYLGRVLGGYIEQINKSMYSTVIKSQHGVGVSQIGPQVYKPSIKLPWTAQCAHACTRQNVFKM